MTKPYILSDLPLRVYIPPLGIIYPPANMSSNTQQLIGTLVQNGKHCHQVAAQMHVSYSTVQRLYSSVEDSLPKHPGGWAMSTGLIAKGGLGYSTYMQLGRSSLPLAWCLVVSSSADWHCSRIHLWVRVPGCITSFPFLPYAMLTSSMVPLATAFSGFFVHSFLSVTM